MISKMTTGAVLFGVMIAGLSSCAILPISPGIQESRGFPFEKKWPGCDHPPGDFYYDKNYKWFTGQDGLMVQFDHPHFFKSPLKCTIEDDVYNVDLVSSEKEKQYHAAYRAMEEEFDRKYAGWIKEKLLAVSDWKINYWKTKEKFVVKKQEFDQVWLPKVKAGRLKYKIKFDPDTKKKFDGAFSIEYPGYLVGQKLPDELLTPSSFFSPEFLEYYGSYSSENDRGLFNYIQSFRFLDGGHFYWDANRLEQEVYSILYSRFRVQFVEYVLTYYYFKNYSSTEEKLQVGHDLAAFYREVAFRAVAEATYVYADSVNWLSYREKCAIANYYADRIHNFILIAFTDLEKFKYIRQEHELKLDKICHNNLALSRSIPLGPDCIMAINPQCVSETNKKNKEIRNLIDENQENCVND